MIGAADSAAVPYARGRSRPSHVEVWPHGRRVWSTRIDTAGAIVAKAVYSQQFGSSPDSTSGMSGTSSCLGGGGRHRWGCDRDSPLDGHRPPVPPGPPPGNEQAPPEGGAPCRTPGNLPPF